MLLPKFLKKLTYPYGATYIESTPPPGRPPKDKGRTVTWVTPGKHIWFDGKCYRKIKDGDADKKIKW